MNTSFQKTVEDRSRSITADPVESGTLWLNQADQIDRSGRLPNK